MIVDAYYVLREREREIIMSLFKHTQSLTENAVTKLILFVTFIARGINGT